MKNTEVALQVTGFALVITLSMAMAACQEPSGQSTSSAQTVAPPPAATTASNSGPPSLLATYTPSAFLFKPLPNCNLEWLDGKPFGAQARVLDSARVHTITGWVDPVSVANRKIWMRFDDAQAQRYLHAPIELTIQRSDVLTNDPAAPRVSGFSLQWPASALPVGQYHVYIAVTSDNVAHVCDNGRHISVVH